jgi:hypothetical protein
MRDAAVSVLWLAFRASRMVDVVRTREDVVWVHEDAERMSEDAGWMREGAERTVARNA